MKLIIQVTEFLKASHTGDDALAEKHTVDGCVEVDQEEVEQVGSGSDHKHTCPWDNFAGFLVLDHKRI